MSAAASSSLSSGRPRIAIPAGLRAAIGPVTSWRRIAVLVVSVITMGVEIALLLNKLGVVWFGDLPLSPSIFPAGVLALLCGGRLFGRSRTRGAAYGFWIAAGLAILALVVAYARQRLNLTVPALITAGFDEELVYRLAIPAVLAVLLRTVRVPAGAARIASLAIAAGWFVLLPGHRDQMHSAATAVPFLAYALLAALLVYRSGSIVPMAIGHAISNCLTILLWRNAVPADARSLMLACLLSLLVVAYGRPQRLVHSDAGGLVDVRTGLPVTLLDLRDDHPHVATLADGRVIALETA
ncbi:MAG TPA: CPBP family glutamic-type intramembrane protease [Acidimicrobiales bacterium]